MTLLVKHGSERLLTITVDQALDRKLFHGVSRYTQRDNSWRLVYDNGRIGHERIECFEFELSNLGLKRVTM